MAQLHGLFGVFFEANGPGLAPIVPGCSPPRLDDVYRAWDVLAVPCVNGRVNDIYEAEELEQIGCGVTSEAAWGRSFGQCTGAKRVRVRVILFGKTERPFPFVEVPWTAPSFCASMSRTLSQPHLAFSTNSQQSSLQDLH